MLRSEYKEPRTTLERIQKVTPELMVTLAGIIGSAVGGTSIAAFHWKTRVRETESHDRLTESHDIQILTTQVNQLFELTLKLQDRLDRKSEEIRVLQKQLMDSTMERERLVDKCADLEDQITVLRAQTVTQDINTKTIMESLKPEPK